MSAYTRRARQIIELVVTDQDPFNVMKMLAADMPVCILAEAWSPEARNKVIAQADGMGYTLQDHLIIGDYDLALWYTNRIPGNPDAYVVSINNAEHNPLSKEAQQTDYVNTARQPPLVAIKRKVSSWIEQHGGVIIGSVMTDRNQLYLKMFRRLFPGYRFAPFHGESFKYGFRLSKT